MAERATGLDVGERAVRDRLRSAIEEGARRPLLVGITGPVGAGKSTLAQRVVAAGGIVIGTDDYLPDYEALPREEWDLPERSDLDRLAQNLRDLAAGRATSVPIWTHEGHRRAGEREVGPVDPGSIIAVEGIHALHERVAHLYDVRVFVGAAPTERWGRWERLERAGVRTWGVEAARDFFDAVAEPTFNRYADTYRDAADLIVENPG